MGRGGDMPLSSTKLKMLNENAGYEKNGVRQKISIIYGKEYILSKRYKCVFLSYFVGIFFYQVSILVVQSLPSLIVSMFIYVLF